MTWNYRIVRHKKHRHTWYGLHECYYDEKGKLDMWATDPEVCADTRSELLSTLGQMIRDATRSDYVVIDAKNLPKEKKK